MIETLVGKLQIYHIYFYIGLPVYLDDFLLCYPFK